MKTSDHKLLSVGIALLFAAGIIFLIAREAARLEHGGGGLNQLHYRWRNDDADKLMATWAAPQDRSVLGIPKNATRRLRIAIANEGTSTSPYVRYQLEYATSIENAWIPVGLASSSKEHWVMSYSPYVIDGAPTTNLPGGIDDPPGIFVPGEFRDTDNRTGPITLPPNSFTELEFSIRATDNATENGTYYFRITRARTTAQESIHDAISLSTGIAIGKIKDALRAR